MTAPLDIAAIRITANLVRAEADTWALQECSEVATLRDAGCYLDALCDALEATQRDHGDALELAKLERDDLRDALEEVKRAAGAEEGWSAIDAVRMLLRKLAAISSEWEAGQVRERALRAQLAAVSTGTEGVWFWQGAGDEPESLTCPVVMRAETLRAFVAEQAALEGERDRLQAHADEIWRILGAVDAESGEERADYLMRERDRLAANLAAERVQTARLRGLLAFLDRAGEA